MGDDGKIYDHVRAAVQLWADRPQSNLSTEQSLRELTAVMVNALSDMAKPGISAHGIAAFERLVALLPHDSYDVDLVRQELIGRAPRRDDGLPDAIRAMLGIIRGDQVLNLLRTHNWGPLRRPQGRRRVAPSKMGYCPKHGNAAELRQYSNGKTRATMIWRCVLCMNDNRQRARGQSKIIVDSPVEN